MEEGVREALPLGPIKGFPLTDMRVEILKASFSNPDFARLTLKMASYEAFRRACEDGRPVLLLPIMSLTVTTPNEFLGEIIADLHMRKSQVTNIDAKDRITVIEAHAPLTKMFGYSTDIRSLSQGGPPLACIFPIMTGSRMSSIAGKPFGRHGCGRRVPRWFFVVFGDPGCSRTKKYAPLLGPLDSSGYPLAGGIKILSGCVMIFVAASMVLRHAARHDGAGAMSRAGEILAFFREAADGRAAGGPVYVSGDMIASSLSISRTAVWKVLKQLSGMGYAFETVKGRGYRLTASPDRLFPWEIERHLSTRFVGRDIVYRDQVDSTNAVAFNLALAGCAEGTCVVAESQTAGRGRLMRTWQSPHGKNLYISCVFRPALHPSAVYPLTFIPCLAVLDTLAALGVEGPLKWPNDVLIGRRKVSGTLIELSMEADRVRFVVIGIGLNVNMAQADMADEIRETATSLLVEGKKHFERARVCGMLLDDLEKYYGIARDQGTDAICRLWEERARIRGTYMEINQMGTIYRGTAEGIGPDGAVLLRENGVLTRVIAGDVSID